MKVLEVIAELELIEQEMKGHEFGVDITQKKLSSGLALLALDALQAYLCGEIESAADDFATLASELRDRQEAPPYSDPYD